VEFLIADVGGTNLRLGWYRSEDDIPIYKELYKFGDNFIEFIQRALEHFSITSFSLVVGAAGPVINGVCNLTNNGLILDENELRESFDNKHIYVLNDLELLGYYVGSIADREKPHLEIVTASGTGLGLTIIAISGSISIFPTEYGHAGKDAPAQKLFGAGLARIFSSIAGFSLDPAEITARSKLHAEHPDELADEAIDTLLNLTLQMLKDISLQFLPKKIYLGGTLFYEMRKLLENREKEIQTLINKTPVTVPVPIISFLPENAAYLGGRAFLSEKVILD